MKNHFSCILVLFLTACGQPEEQAVDNVSPAVGYLAEQNNDAFKEKIEYDQTKTEEEHQDQGSHKEQENPSLNSDKPCHVEGCSGEICTDSPTASACVWREEYKQYRHMQCTRLTDGSCGWLQLHGANR